MKSMRTILSLFICFVLAIVSVACGSGGGGGSSSGDGSSSSALVGTWLISEQEDPCNNVWEPEATGDIITFNQNGTYSNNYCSSSTWNGTQWVCSVGLTSSNGNWTATSNVLTIDGSNQIDYSISGSALYLNSGTWNCGDGRILPFAEKYIKQ